MIKLRYEGGSTLNFWVDKDTGYLCIETETDIIEIPHNEALQILNEMRNGLIDFEESKHTAWDKFWNKTKG